MKKQIIEIIINNKSYEIAIEPSMTLLEVLRDELNLTGTKCGCGLGECGACTVLVNGKPILSCCTLAMSVRGKNVLTIEGLTDGLDLHPIQEAFVEHGAFQCGFCTPGMIMMAKALLDEKPYPSREEVEEWFAGNICRCTGYVKIVDAVLAAAEIMRKQDRT